MNNVNSVSRKTVREMIRKKEQQMHGSGPGSVSGKMVRKKEEGVRQAAVHNLEGGE